MKFFTSITALLFAGSVAAFPLVAPDSRDLSVKASPAVELELDARTYDVTSYPTSYPTSYGTGSCSRCSASNPIGGIIDQLLVGLDVDVGIYALLSNKNFAKFILEASLDAEFLVQFDKLCTKTDFLVKLDVLLSNNVFLKTCAGLVAEFDINAQIGILLSNVAFMKKCTAYLASAKIIAKFSALFGASINFGVKLSAWLGNVNFVNLLVKLCGNGSVGVKLGLLLGDVTIIAKIRALLTLNANFGASLGALLADVNFMAHVCSVLGLSVDLSAKIKVIFGLDVSFAAKLEAILGVAFKGKLTAILGSGSCTQILIKFFGAGSFHSILSGCVSGGLFFKTFAKLFISGNFAIKFCGFISAWFSANVDIFALCGKIFADVSFFTNICGLFGIKANIAISLSALLGGKGFLNLCNGFISGGGLLSGSLSIFGSLLGFVKGLGH